MSGISVVIPTYNRADLVPLSIESVLRQTHPAAEIVVVDDGSSDHTQSVLRGFGSKIRVIYQANAGLSGARNVGIEAARHEWVGFLDDDDEYALERLAIAVESFGRCPSSDVHVCNTAIVVEGQGDRNLFQLRGVVADQCMPLDRPLPWVLRGCFFAQSMIARRSVLRDVGLFRNTLYEDMDMFVRLASHGSWVVDSRPALRLIRRGNAPAMSDDWRSRPLERCAALVRIHREALGIEDLTQSEATQVKEGLATYLFELGVALSQSGRGGEARERFLEAARTFEHPRSRMKSYTAFVGGKTALRLLDRLKGKPQGFVR